MKTRRLLLKYVVTLFVLMHLSTLTILLAQQDVNIKISQASINDNILPSYMEARGINFGDYTGRWYADGWFVNLDGGSITIGANNTAIISANVVATIENPFVTNNVTTHVSCQINGSLEWEGSGAGFKLVFQPNNVTNIQVTSGSGWDPFNFLTSIVQGSLDVFSQQMGPIDLMSGTELLPSAITSYFTSPTPTLTTQVDPNPENSNIVISYTVAGDRQITMQNNVAGNNSVGNVQTLEGGNWNTHASPYVASWALNSNQSFRIASSAINYSSQWYRFNWWDEDHDKSNEKDITVGGDHTYTGDYLPAQPVSIQTSLEGTNTAVSNSLTFFNSAVSSPYSDYGFMPPNNSSVGAISSLSFGNTSWTFRNWEDGSTSATRVISPSSPSTYTATYKGVHRTSNSAALANTSQRKAVRTDEGYIFLGYESLGRVWLERSTDEGGTWSIVNNGQPIDGGPAAKSPSLDYLTDVDYYEQNNELYVTYQQETPDGHYTIQVARFDGTGTKLSDQTIYTSASSYSNDATPVIGVTWYDRNGEWRKQMVGIWREPASSGVSAGLYWYPAYYIGSTFYWNDLAHYYLIAGTGANSVNPTMDVFKYDGNARYNGTLYYPFAWEENATSVKYGKVTCGTSGIGNSGALASISNFFTGNYNPSMIAYSNTDYRLVRNVYLDNPLDTPPQAVLTDPNSPNTYWVYGNYVTSATINKYVNDLDWTTGYAVGWTQNSGSGYSNFAVKSTNLNSSLSVNSSGKDMQLHNGWDFSTMHGVTLSTSSPYAFQRTGNVNNGQIPKGSDQPIGVGRTLVASVPGEGAVFYFTVGDISIDGTMVRFPGLCDTMKVVSTEQLMQNLVSEPFAVHSGSSLSYGIEYGVNDSVLATRQLGTGGLVKFRLDFIDAQTGKMVNAANEALFDSVKTERHNRTNEAVNFNVQTAQNLRLRLSIVTNLPCDYAVGSILVPSGPALAKSYAAQHQMDLQYSPEVTHFALLANYPNPFNPSTQINYEVPVQAYVSLKVYDVLGRLVETLVEGSLEPGYHAVTFDGAKFASGIYFTRMVARPSDGSETFIQTRKIVLTK